MFISGLAAQFKKSVQVKSRRAPNKRPSKHHKTHSTVPIEEESGEKKTQLVKIQREVQQKIQNRMKKIEKIKHSVELSRKSSEKDKADSVEVFRALLHCIERSQVELLEVYPSLCSPPHTKNWTDVRINTHLRVETLRRALTQLQEELSKEMEKMMDVTLDPDSAHCLLILSDDGKQVTFGDKRQNRPDTPERFDRCPCVLGKEGFSSGRFYYEVQVRGKTDWDLGVAIQSVNRTGAIRAKLENGYWTLFLRNEIEYRALDSPSVPLSLKQAPQKVGVFVDYEEGLVSFYDVEARSHIYSFTGQSFTEKLYPLFSPHLNKGVVPKPGRRMPTHRESAEKEAIKTMVHLHLTGWRELQAVFQDAEKHWKQLEEQQEAAPQLVRSHLVEQQP
ncbi:hypothetical protein MHYP_G00015450 [Metynnis hypsauchen]